MLYKANLNDSAKKEGQRGIECGGASKVPKGAIGMLFA